MPLTHHYPLFSHEKPILLSLCTVHGKWLPKCHKMVATEAQHPLDAAQTYLDVFSNLFKTFSFVRFLDFFFKFVGYLQKQTPAWPRTPQPRARFAFLQARSLLFTWVQASSHGLKWIQVGSKFELFFSESLKPSNGLITIKETTGN